MEALNEGLHLGLVGMTIVFLALATISVGVGLLRKFEPGPVEKPADPDAISPETLAVIAAAVAVSIGRPHRVRHIRYRKRPPGEGWSSAGRVAIMTSHAPRGSI